jgi:hypothetical protein
MMAGESIYGASPIRRSRRTKAAMQDLRVALYHVVEAQQPMTVRQVFYRGVGFGLWPKTETAYKNIVCRLLGDMRREGLIPYSWIADSTRWMRKPRTFSSMQDALEHTAKTYRRALWQDQDTYLEVWLEKEALAGVVFEVTDPWDVPLMVTRGYPSLSFLWSAAETIKAQSMTERPIDVGFESLLDELPAAMRGLSYDQQTKDVRILYIGDRDPSGDDIARNVAEQLEDMSECYIDFVRVAVTAEQVDEYDLPTRPTKRTDTRTAKWDGNGSVEVDAIEPDVLRDLIVAEIEGCIDERELDIIRAVEAEEREMARRMVEREFAS